MFNFLINYGSIVTEINRLLGLRFIDEFKTPLGMSLKSALLYHNRGKFDDRDVQFAKLAFLVKHLRTIENYDSTILNAFATDVQKILKWEDYYGWRMEVNTTASLISKKIPFRKTEAPDFSLSESKIFIECGSSHLSRRTANRRKPINKLHQKVIEKSKMPYCNSSTALFLDITNLYFNSLDNQTFSNNNIKQCVIHASESTKTSFGSILLFSYSMTPQRQYSSNYLRVDTNKISRNLLGFLNTYFPINSFWSGPIYTPGQG